jgi:hypothetical protein
VALESYLLRQELSLCYCESELCNAPGDWKETLAGTKKMARPA